MAQLTLLDVKKLEAGVGFDLIEEALTSSPELRVLPTEAISGTEMKLTVRTGLPTVGFRNINEGFARSKSTYEDKVFQCHNIDGQAAVDKKLWDGSIDPMRLGEAEVVGFLEAAFQLTGKQIYYGTANDAKGFPGLIAQMDSSREVDATGASAKSSVFMIRAARQGVQVLLGNGQSIQMQDTWNVETILDASNNPYQAYVNWISGSLGCRLSDKKACVRIKNIGTASGKTLTDALMYQALEKFTTDYNAMPTHIFMTPRSLEQLRSSRTNTGSNVKGEVPTLPSDFLGIPILSTSSISNNESI